MTNILNLTNRFSSHAFGSRIHALVVHIDEWVRAEYVHGGGLDLDELVRDCGTNQTNELTRDGENVRGVEYHCHLASNWCDQRVCMCQLQKLQLILQT